MATLAEDNIYNTLSDQQIKDLEKERDDSVYVEPDVDTSSLSSVVPVQVNDNIELDAETIAKINEEAITGDAQTGADSYNASIEQQKYKDQFNEVVPFEDLPPEKQTALSQKDIEGSDQFVSDILTYRKGRYGTEKTAGADFFKGIIPGVGGGVLDATNVSLVDDWLDNYRFVTGNEINALEERDWLQNLKKKSEAYKENGDVEKYNETQEILGASARLYQDTERLAPIFGWDSTVGGVFSKKRFEGMSASNSALEIIDAVGGHIAAGFSSPSSILSLGASKFLFAGMRRQIIKGAIAKATVSPVKGTIGSVAVGATIDGAAAGYLDTIVQGTEIEAGVRKKYDVNRTLIAMGAGAAIGGGISGFGARQTYKTKAVFTESEMKRLVKVVDDERVKVAKDKINKADAPGKAIAKAYRKEIQDTFGEDVVKLDIKGNVTDINREAIKKKGKELLAEQGYTTALVEPSINISMYRRTTAAIIEIFELGKDIKTLRKFNIVKKGGTPKEQLATEKRVLKLFEPLKVNKSGKAINNERISDRVYKILQSPDINVDVPWQIMARYGVTSKEYAAIIFAEVSKAAQILGGQSAISKKLAFANRTMTAQEESEDFAQAGAGAAFDALVKKGSMGKINSTVGKKLKEAVDDTDTGQTFSSFFQRLNNIRRAGLVSAVVTAMRNNLAQYPRMGIDTLIHAVESTMNPHKTFSFGSSWSQIKYTYIDPEQAVSMSNIFLRMYEKQEARIWNQYMEVKGTARRKNPHTETLSGVDPKYLSTPRAMAEKGITKGLDVWENVVFKFNVVNRWQESLYRRGAFASSIQRQLADQGKDINKVLSRGRYNEDVSEDMVAKAVDYALEFTYGAEPKVQTFQLLNQLITNSPFTLAIPFPRFMFKAMEMAYNYNVTGMLTGLYRTRFGTKGFAKESTKEAREVEAAYRQLAEGFIGSAVLIPLGYLLRDPENDVAGSEWNKLKDGTGKEFDARVYGPIITPYLLIGEAIHRAKRGITPFTVKELGEAITGTNFRNVGSIHNVLTDINAMTNLDEMTSWSAKAGRVLGDASVGFLQPILQVTDFKSQSEKKRDYREDPLYASGVEAFLSELWVPINRRIQPFLKTTDDYFGTELEDKNYDYTVDPRITDVPERLIPILKVFFGATMNRVPPEYIMKLGQLGFTYKDFMAKSPFPSINNIANKHTAERISEEMPEFLSSSYELAKLENVEKPDALVAGMIDGYLKNIRKEALAEALLKGEDGDTMMYLRRYRSLPARSRLAAIQRMEALIRKNPDRYPKGKIDLQNIDHLAELIALARHLSNIR